MDLRRLIVAGTKCFPSRARARSQIIAGALRGLSLSLQCSGFGFLGANLWCTALLSLEEPAPLSQRPGCGAESNGNTAEDSVRPGYSTWWGSRTRGVAQQLLGSLGTLEKLLLEFGSHRKGLEQVSLLELKPIPSSCLNNTAFLSQFSLALSWAPACCSLSEGQERSTGVAEARSCCPQSNGGPLNMVMP